MKKVIAVTAVVAMGMSLGAVAQDGDPDWEIDGYVVVSSDYRDRGISMSDRDPAVSASLGLFHKSGLYAGVDGALLGPDFGDNQKTEFYLGYSHDAGDYVYDVSVELDGFHTATSDFYTEVKASVSRDFGLAFIRGGLAYAPDGRWSSPDIDSLYSYLDLEVPVPTIPELTLVTHVGYDVRDGRSNLWDWSVGVSAFIDRFEFSLAYEDSSLDHRLANGQFTFGGRLYF